MVTMVQHNLFYHMWRWGNIRIQTMLWHGHKWNTRSSRMWFRAFQYYTWMPDWPVLGYCYSKTRSVWKPNWLFLQKLDRICSWIWRNWYSLFVYFLIHLSCIHTLFSEGEYWLGLEQIYQLTNQKSYALKIYMESQDNDTAEVRYGTFKLTENVSNCVVKLKMTYVYCILC